MKTRHLRRSRPRVEELEGRLVPSAVVSTSTNWAGYAVTAGRNAVTAVAGTWVVPAVSGSISGYSAAWVGIDGFNSSTVEQIGTEADFTGGHPQYYAWYEMYPSYSVNLGLTIRPGDTISASVAYSAGTSQFTLQITDLPQGGGAPQSFTTTQKAQQAQRSSAEWVVEAPSSFFGVLPLANFGTTTFSKAQAAVNGSTGPADASGAGKQLHEVNMTSQFGAPEATTSALTDSGSPATSSFSVTFNPPKSTPPPHNHHGGHAGSNSTDQATTALADAALSLAAASVTLGSSGLVANPRLPAPSLPTTTPTPQAANVGATLGLSVNLTPVTVPSHRADTGDASLAAPTGRAAAAELLPPPTEVAPPVGGVTPGDLDAPQADQPPTNMPGAFLDTGRAHDAAFVDGRWEPAAPLEGARGAAADGGTNLDSAGLALSLALGGTWAIAMRDAAARRRRPKLR
jgi:hypothetical protein